MNCQLTSCCQYLYLSSRLLLVGLLALFITMPALAQDYSNPGAFTVHNLETMILKDNVRNTDMSIRVYYPEGTGPFPVIAFSHSVRGNKDMFSEISNHWASHGYVIIHPSHDDEGVSMTEAGMHPPEQKVRNRLRDIIASLDGLDQIENQLPALAGKLNRDRLAVAGHSYGSFISMIAGGVTIDIGATSNSNLGDTRVRCIVPLSPSGPGDYGTSEISWRNLSVPALFFNGTDDRRAGRAENWRMEPFRLSPAGNKFEVIIEDATHMSYGGDRPGTAPPYVKAASTAFWDFCLHDSVAGKTYLEQDGFMRFAKDGATISFK